MGPPQAPPARGGDQAGDGPPVFGDLDLLAGRDVVEQTEDPSFDLGGKSIQSGHLVRIPVTIADSVITLPWTSGWSKLAVSPAE